MTVVIDGVLLASGEPGAQEAWRGLLPRFAAELDARIVLLDRGAADDVGGMEVVPFPSFNPDFGAADSVLLEQVCRHFDAEVFLSTSFTTPLGTPSVMVVHDVPDERGQAIAIAHARRFVCASTVARAALLERHPELAASPVRVAGPDELARALADEVRACAGDGAAGLWHEFGRRWNELRQIQAAVDVWGRP